MQMNPQNLSTLSPPVTCFHYYSTSSHKNTERLNGIPIPKLNTKMLHILFQQQFPPTMFPLFHSYVAILEVPYDVTILLTTHAVHFRSSGTTAPLSKYNNNNKSAGTSSQ